MQKYFKRTGENLFCQDFVISGALAHTNQFLKKLDEQVDFSALWHEKLLEAYVGKGTIGAPAYKPEMMLKMLFLSYLFSISEREIERVVNDSISMKVFLNLSLDEKAPDHSGLTKFKNRILAYDKYKGRNIFKELFDDVIIYAQEKGVDLGYTQAIDSTHTIADVNTKKDKKRQEPKSKGGDGKKPRDPDAKWGVKRVKKVKTVEGKTVKVNESHFAYKSHLSVNTETNLVTSYVVTPMNTYDGYMFSPLMLDDIFKGLTKPFKTTYTADRMYDDGELHAWLNQNRFKDAISLKRVKDEDKNERGFANAKFTLFTTQEEFEAGIKERYVVERVNGSVKTDHTMDRARYLGIQKMNIQTALGCMAHNLKTLVKMWTGVGLRSPVLSHVS